MWDVNKESNGQGLAMGKMQMFYGRISWNFWKQRKMCSFLEEEKLEENWRVFWTMIEKIIIQDNDR